MSSILWQKLKFKKNNHDQVMPSEGHHSPEEEISSVKTYVSSRQTQPTTFFWSWRGVVSSRAQLVLDGPIDGSYTL